MGRNIRWTHPYSLVELSNRCIQGRFLLRPSKLLNLLIVGVLAMALRANGIRIHAITVASNHWHILASVPSTAAMARAMGFFGGNVSKEAGRLHKWRGILWQGRYHHSTIDDDEATQIGRLRYILAQGVKDGLVWRSQDWPGVNSVRALIEGKPLSGLWISRKDQWAARRRKGADASDAAHGERVEIHLEPLPCWSHLPEPEWRRRVAEMVRDIEQEARARHMREKTQPLGPRRVRKVNPHHAPEKVSWSPQPHVIARDPKRRKELWNALASVVAAFRDAADRLAKGDSGVRFPEGTFPPGLPYVPTVADLLSGG
jgi:REP element-mobilizing transposase RayT